MSTPRFIVSAHALLGTAVELKGPELHHLRVRRLPVGSIVILTDGAGIARTAILRRLERDQAVLTFEPMNSETSAESPLRIVLAQAVLKSTHMDLIVEKTCELGAQALIPFTCARTIVGDASPTRRERWLRITAAATTQSGRSFSPKIQTNETFPTLVKRTRATDEQRFILLEPDRAKGQPPVDLGSLARPESALVVVGPEGGFTQSEANLALENGFLPISLGPRVMRAETAAIVVVALLQFMWGDLA